MLMRTVSIMQSCVRVIVRMHVLAAIRVAMYVLVRHRLMMVMVFAVVPMRMHMNATVRMTVRMGMSAGNGGIAYAGMRVTLAGRM
jgi:hypothetical protein